MNAAGAPAASLRMRVLAMAERRLPALTRLRDREPLPIHLHRRRIYVLPSMFGIVFAILLAVMQLGALNFANNPALLLTCLLAAAAWMSLFAGFRTLADLQLEAISSTPCHVGEMAQVSFRFAVSARARPSLRMRCGGIDHPLPSLRVRRRRSTWPWPANDAAGCDLDDCACGPTSRWACS